MASVPNRSGLQKDSTSARKLAIMKQHMDICEVHRYEYTYRNMITNITTKLTVLVGSSEGLDVGWEVGYKRRNI